MKKSNAEGLLFLRAVPFFGTGVERILNLLKKFFSVHGDELDGEKIKAYTDRKFTLLEETDSTNAYLKRNGELFGDGEAVIAKRQTSGRGRLGRTFISPSGGIYMSLFLKPENGEIDGTDITALCAVSTAMAIEDVTGEKTKIKWVNDIFLRGKKVCGILTEALTENEKIKYIIVGIGIDVYRQKKLPEELKDTVGFLFEKQGDIINKLAAETADNFFAMYKTGKYIEEYRKRSMLDGQTVEYTENGSVKSGTVLGVDEKCGLRIKDGDGEKVLRSGEVRITKYERT